MPRPRNNTVFDAATQTMRCELCGDEVPIPLGNCRWVSDVMQAFVSAHRGKHAANPDRRRKCRTWFSVPGHPSKEP